MAHTAEMASDADNATIPGLQGDNFNNDSILHKLNDDEVKILMPTFMYLTLLSLIGIIGNSLVCHVYWKRYRLSNSQYFILCLSAIDLFSCCIAIPLEIATTVDQYTFEYTWLCKLSRFFNTLGTLSSSFLLFCIAIDRYRKVCRPFEWQIKVSVAKLLCVLSVLPGLLFSWTTIFIYGKRRFEIPEFGLTGTYCSIDDAMLNTIFPLINSAVFGGYFIVGTISICILYFLVLREIKRHAEMIPKELSLRNTSVPMLSTTMDGSGSRISGELDANILAYYDVTKVKRESKNSFSKHKTRKANSESSSTDRNGFELSSSMDCRDQDTSIVLTDKDKESVEHVQSDYSGQIKSHQTNNDENLESCNKDSVINREVNDNDVRNADCQRGNFGASEIENIVIVENQNKLNNLVPVNEDEHLAEQTPETETEIKDNRNMTRSIVETNRNMQTPESMPPRSIRARISSICSLLSNAFVRRMASPVSGTSTDSAAIKKQYFKQARARKTAFLVFLISIAFILSYMPHVLLKIIRQLVNNFVDSMTNDGRAVYNFFLRSYFLNCAINPVIYGVCDTRFRTACQEIFSHCCRRREPRGVN